MAKAIKIEGRAGIKLLRCPYCGHVFANQKQFLRHLLKSHNERIRKA